MKGEESSAGNSRCPRLGGEHTQGRERASAISGTRVAILQQLDGERIEGLGVQASKQCTGRNNNPKKVTASSAH